MSLKNLVVHPNAEFLDEEICLIKDFLPQEVLSRLLDIISASEAGDWEKYANKGGQWEGRVLTFDDDIVKATVSNLVETVFKDKLYDIKCEVIRRNRDGQDLLVHYDNQAQVTCEHGLVLYLNDDYEGGEIFYPERQKSYKPLKNSLVIHSASKEYAHGVKAVSGGTRYYITLWTFYNNDEKGF